MQIIETRLKMTLPEDIASALTDGVILCHLANYVRPRSVASIHVPSPGVVSVVAELQWKQRQCDTQHRDLIRNQSSGLASLY